MRPQDIFAAIQSQESVEQIWNIPEARPDVSLAPELTKYWFDKIPLLVTDKVGINHKLSRSTLEMWFHIKFDFRNYLRLSQANPIVPPFNLCTVLGSTLNPTFHIQVDLYGSGIPDVVGFRIVNPQAGYISQQFQAPNLFSEPVTFDIRYANNDLRVYVDEQVAFVDNSFKFVHDLHTLRVGELDTAFETKIFEILIAYEDTRGYRLDTAYPAEVDPRNKGYTGPAIPYFEYNSQKFDEKDINILAQSYYAVEQTDAIAFKFDPMRQYYSPVDVTIANLITTPVSRPESTFELFSTFGNNHRKRADINLKQTRHQIILDEAYNTVSPGEKESLGFKVRKIL